MKLAQLSVLAVLAIASQGAFAQTSSDPRMAQSSSMGSPQSGTTGGATDGSAVTNVGSALASDSTIDQTTTTTTEALPTGEMANTGGEPELMLLAGVLLASGGLLLRRKAGSLSI